MASCERGRGSGEKGKLREWGHDEILGCTVRLVPLAFERQGRWGQSAINELERLARPEGRLTGGFSPRGSQRRRSQLCAMAPLAQCRAPPWACGYGACRTGQAAARADRCGPAPGRERVALGSRLQLTEARARSRFCTRSL